MFFSNVVFVSSEYSHWFSLSDVSIATQWQCKIQTFFQYKANDQVYIFAFWNWKWKKVQLLKLLTISMTITRTNVQWLLRKLSVLLCIDIVFSPILDKIIWNKNRGMDYFTLYFFRFHFSIRKGRFLKCCMEVWEWRMVIYQLIEKRNI